MIDEILIDLIWLEKKTERNSYFLCNMAMIDIFLLVPLCIHN